MVGQSVLAHQKSLSLFSHTCMAVCRIAMSAAQTSPGVLQRPLGMSERVEQEHTAVWCLKPVFRPSKATRMQCMSAFGSFGPDGMLWVLCCSKGGSLEASTAWLLLPIATEMWGLSLSVSCHVTCQCHFTPSPPLPPFLVARLLMWHPSSSRTFTKTRKTCQARCSCPSHARHLSALGL